MSKISTLTNIFSKLALLKLATILLAAAVLSGCISAKSAKSAPAEAATSATAAASAVAIPPAITSWMVVAGEHLWGIAANWEVFNLPEKWPLLYKANRDQIEDADLIFPGQVLAIPRNSIGDEIDAAIHHAKNRGVWAVGPVELSDQGYLGD